MTFEDDRLFYWPDADASSPRQRRWLLASVKGQQQSVSHEKNHVFTIITTYPQNLEIIFIICPKLQHRPTCLRRNIYIYEYCFTLLSAHSWQYRDRRKPEARTMPYSYFEWLRGFYKVHSIIGSTVHYRPLNSLEHCICTTTMPNIRPDQDANLVPPGYKPQSIRMSHLGRPAYPETKHLAEYHSFFSKVSARIVAQYTGDTLPPPPPPS